MIRVIKNEAKRGEILIYDQIGPDFFGEGHSVAAKKFASDLRDMGEIDEIVVKINSPGGDVWDGLAIYNTLNQHKARKIVEIEGLAASAASFIAMVGDEIRMAENALMMIHLAQGITMGDRNEHAKQIEVLSKHDDRIAETYAARSGKDVAYFMDLMTKETWLSAEEAMANGLATAIIPSKRIEACAGPECAKRFGFKNVPETAKRFFSRPAAIVGTISRETPMGKKAACGCGNRAKKKKTNVVTFADLMNGAIEAAVTEERTKEAIHQELATAAGLEVADLEALFTAEGGCPTMDEMTAFAGVEGMPAAEDQQSAAEADGCTYEDAEGTVTNEKFDCMSCDGTGVDDDGDECSACGGTGKIDAVAAKVAQIERDAVDARLAEIAAHAW